MMNKDPTSLLLAMALKDGRSWLLEKLLGYQPADDVERAMKQTTIEFVATQPDCFSRQLSIGHVTGSAWVLNIERTKVLLTHHRKLDKWMQLGGHSDGDPNTLKVALREAQEESGIDQIVPINAEIFDIDVHKIPQRGVEPEHIHYDIRFLFQANARREPTVSSESHDVAWVELERITRISTTDSVLRMIAKTKRLKDRE